MLDVRRWNQRWILVAAAAMLLFASCGDDDKDTLVTIRGIARNIDRGTPITNGRVSLLGTDYADDVATGTDGSYLLQVPKGSTLHLLVDDFDPSVDVWIPFINVDAVPVIANGDIDNYDIHGCPNTVCKTPIDSTFDGSIAVWDNYLQNYDSMNGNMFVPTRVRDSAGTIIIAMGDCTTGDSIMVTTDRAEFPVAYMIKEKFVPPSDIAFASCGAGADMFYPPTRSMTDDSGFAMSFGDPAFSGETVTVSTSDRNATATFPVPSPLVVPVRPGALTFVWGTVINGRAVDFQEYACACGFGPTFCN